MRYRKPDILLLLSIVVGIGVLATTAVHADEIKSVFDPGEALSGLCIDSPSHDAVCAPVLPLPYQRVAATPLVAPGADLNLRYDAEKFEKPLLPLLRYRSDRNSAQPGWTSYRQLGTVDLNFNLDQTGASMNMDLGTVEFNVILDDSENSLVEPVIYIGVDNRW